jgi:hypothetical protein
MTDSHLRSASSSGDRTEGATRSAPAPIKIALATLIACGALLLVMGLIIWTGNGDRLIPVHVALGVVLVVSLWTLAAIAARSGVPTGTVTFAASWGLSVVLLGLAQEELVQGSWHWTIQVLHLAISMGAIWWGRRLVKLIGRSRSHGGSAEGHVPEAMSVVREK